MLGDQISYLLISLQEFDPVVKRGLLLTYVGEQANDVFDILPDTSTDYAAAVKTFTDHFDPLQSGIETCLVAIFDFEIRQEESEPERLKDGKKSCPANGIKRHTGRKPQREWL